jgi:hypothetical protein
MDRRAATLGADARGMSFRSLARARIVRGRPVRDVPAGRGGYGRAQRHGAQVATRRDNAGRRRRSSTKRNRVKKMKTKAAELLANPLYGMAAVVVIVALIGGGAILLLTGDDGKDDTAKTTTEEQKEKKKDKGTAAAKKRKVKPAPVVSGAGTLDVARSEGRLAIAQARGRIKNPSGVSVRVSAAPKQTVTVDWNLSCYKAVGKVSTTRVDHGRYRTRPPATKALPVPLPGADECTATVGVQLTKNLGEGRVKVAVIAG